MSHFVLLGDIINSRELSNRSRAQNLFKGVINEINSEYSGAFLSPLTVTLGDEFQGVLANASQLFAIIHQAQIQLRAGDEPIEVRFALGLGDIETPINNQSAIGMDGSAFHNAREALENAKQEDRHLCFQGDIATSDILDLHCAWIDRIIRQWKFRRLNILHYHRLGDKQADLEKRLGISQPAISQNLSHPDTALVLKTEKTIEFYLNTLIGEQNDAH
ncbi:MAG: SatD family protein [Candidatus Marinimicrobia bacterium]|nr:SatD family protein [Candidatus Neomarinimicrobiota bacterium]MCF7827438.1 SatD family protein [Candidatus Neomarinimicrobiota bacterium]MCF7882313.1 SatD family protein [Candidatus Neomarinimicrobiota bacterium]